MLLFALFAPIALVACGERTDRTPQGGMMDGAVAGGSNPDAATGAAPDAATGRPDAAGPTAPPAALECDEANNPAFGSCLDALITASCWNPDTAGQCIDDGDELAWASGHQRSGSPFGDSFRDADGTSCLELEYFSTGAGADVQFLSAGTENITLDETADGSMRIVCSDATNVLLTPEQAFEFFQCRGLVCQCPLGSKFILPCVTNDLFCEQTGGSWEGCYHQCGEQVSCEVPGCDCGPGKSLVSGVGCEPDPSCD